MPQRSNTYALVRLLLDASDLIILYGALVLAYHLRFHSGTWAVVGPIPSLEVYRATFAFLSLFLFSVLVARGTYSRDRQWTFEQALHVAASLVMGAGLGMVGAFFYRDYSYSRLTVGLGLMLTIVTLVPWHMAKATLLSTLTQRGFGRLRAVLVGDGELAAACHASLMAQPGRVELVGRWGGDGGPLAQSTALPALDSQRDMGDLVMELDLDLVIVALPSSQSERILALIRRLEETSAAVTLIPDVYGIITTSIHAGEFMGMPAIQVGRLAIHGVGGRIKYVLDFAMATVGLIVASPILVAVACIVRFDSRGPILYVQDRVGLDGRVFPMYKFRSMRVDAEAHTGPVWASTNDPRRTRVGAFLRKYSLDELPQLINVLRGEMSLVGPRPERPAFVEEFKRQVPHYMARHRVRSGMTGWAQVSGLRGQSSIEERTRYDIWYIENWSLWLDLKILFKTIEVVLFKPTGA